MVPGGAPSVQWLRTRDAAARPRPAETGDLETDRGTTDIYTLDTWREMDIIIIESVKDNIKSPVVMIQR